MKKISQTNLRKQKRSAKTITKENTNIDSFDSVEKRPGRKIYRATTMDELIKVVIKNSEEIKLIKKRMKCQ